MELGKIKEGRYGKYYEYEVEGEKKILGLEDRKPEDSSLVGVTPETVEQVNELIDKGHLTFKFNDELITAKLVPYVNKRGETVSIIKYSKYYEDSITTSSTYSDVAKIEEQKEAIIAIFSDNSDSYDNYYARIKTDEHLKSVGLGKYRCSVTRTDLSSVVKVIIYFGKKKDAVNPENQVFSMYLKSTSRAGYKVSRVELTHSDYLEALDKDREESKIREEKAEAKRKLLEDCKNEGYRWLKELHDKIWADGKSLSRAEAVKSLEPIVSSTPSDPSSAGKKPLTNISTVIDTAQVRYIGYYVIDNCVNDLENMKKNVMKSLRHIYDYYKLYIVRSTICDEANTKGVESVVGDMDSSSVLDSLDFGEFKKLQRALVKSSQPIYYICMNMFEDIVDADELRNNILRMLKVYYDFNDFPSKDIKAIAKFVAVHDIKEYQEMMLEYNEAIEVMLDEGKPAVKKRTLESIAGGKRGKSFDISFLKAKSYYFERTARLKDDSIDVTKVLEELRALIDEFNTSSDVAILVNIELNADESFIYQFYTFADSSSGGKMDGRRIQYMTKLYNRGRPDNRKIYFDYEF